MTALAVRSVLEPWSAAWGGSFHFALRLHQRRGESCLALTARKVFPEEVFSSPVGLIQVNILPYVGAMSPAEVQKCRQPKSDVLRLPRSLPSVLQILSHRPAVPLICFHSGAYEQLLILFFPPLVLL